MPLDGGTTHYTHLGLALHLIGEFGGIGEICAQIKKTLTEKLEGWGGMKGRIGYKEGGEEGKDRVEKGASGRREGRQEG